MSKKNLIIFITSFFVFLLFFSCKHFEPELYYVNVYSNGHCKYRLEKKYVHKYDYVKLQILPDHGFYVEQVTSRGWSESPRIYKSEEEDNTYYIYIEEDKQNIKITMYSLPRYRLYKNGENYTITSAENTLAGDTVRFTIIPDNGYYYDASSLKIYKAYHYYTEDEVYIDFEQSETNPNEFSFVMPEFDVKIHVDTKFGVSATPFKEKFIQGEKITFNIENHTPNSTFDIRLEGMEGNFNANIANNIKLSDTFELPENLFEENDTGTFYLYIYAYDSVYKYIYVPFTIIRTDTP